MNANGRRRVRRGSIALVSLAVLAVGLASVTGVTSAVAGGCSAQICSAVLGSTAAVVNAQAAPTGAAAASTTTPVTTSAATTPVTTYPGPFPSGRPFLRSAANALYVSAEEGYGGSYSGVLRARAGALGPWEGFRSQALIGTCPATPPSGWVCMGSIALASTDSGRYVSAELGYPGSTYGVLRARALEIGPWERFDKLFLVSSAHTGPIYALRSQASGRFVSVELGYSGSLYAVLRARAAAIGPWEEFTDLP